MKLDDIWRAALAPEPTLSVSAWAERHRVLPPTSAEPGPWRTARVPYLAEIMDALSTGSPYERVVLMKGAQLGGTEVGLNWISYIIHHAPGLALLVMPSLDMARRNTRTRIDPMIEATPVLRERIAAPRSRDAYNSAFTKSFPGGTLVMTGANSASALRSTPARYIMLDEVDGFPVDVDNEGDPVALAIARTVTFKGRRKIFMCSTPTVCGVSRIEKAYAEGDQRKFLVPCLQCGDRAEITWQRIKWPEGRRDQAYLVCNACGGIMHDHEKPRLLAAGAWSATAKGDGRTASFHISTLYSPFATWGEIAIEHGAAQGDPSRMQAWQNLALGLAYEDAAASPMVVGELAARAENYTDAPKGVLVVVGGVDVQDDRVEVEIMGAGLGDETWSLGYHTLVGDPASHQLWTALDELLAEKIRRVDGRQLPIKAACVDTGGHHTVRAYDFVRDKAHRSVWAIRGSSHSGTPPWPRKASRVNKGRVPLYVIGTDALKDAFAARLRVEQPGPGFCHFPVGRGLDYYEGLLSERPLRVYSNGVARRVWMPVSSMVRNEPLDCRVYCYAAIEGLKASGFKYQREVAAAGSAPIPTAIDSSWLSRRSWERK